MFENLCAKLMCEIYGEAGGQDGLEHGITQPLLLFLSKWMTTCNCIELSQQYRTP